MSGRAIGTVVGAVIGFYVGGPQGAYYGAMIGGMAGGLIDPETLQGAQFSGRSVAGSESGLARAIIYGTTTVEVRLMDGEDTPRIGTRTESAGKGGPEIEHDTALLSYAIEICESSELRDTLVGGVIAAWEDEKLVYDVREDSLVSAADNAKWLENKTFYYGEETQTPSALLQSIHGTGNVPAYVGTCRMDVEDEDLVLHGERIPRYRFLVSRCAVEPPNFLLVTGSDINPGDPLLAGARAESPLSFVGIPQSSGGTIAGGTPTYYGGKWIVHGQGSTVGQFSTDNRQTWIPFATDRASSGYLAAGPDGLLVNGIGSASVYDRLGLAPTFGDAVAPLEFATEYPPGTPLRPFGEGNEAYMCCYSGGYYWIDTGGQGELVRANDLSLATQQVVYKRTGFEHIFLQVEVHGGTAYAVTPDGKIISSPDLGATWSVVVDTSPFGAHSPVYLKSGNGKLLALSQDSSKVWTSEDGFAVPHDTGIAGDTTGNPPVYCRFGRGEMMAFTGGNFYIISSTNSLTPALGDMGVMTADGVFFEEPAPLPVRGATGIAAGAAATPAGGGIIIPDAPGYEVDPITGEVIGPESDVGNACGMYLDEVVRSLYRLGSKQLTDDMLDLDALAAYYVRGYSVADVGATSADGIEPLRRTYFFDLPEYDGKIHARLRGGDIDWIIDPDDTIPGEESTLAGKRGQETSYPKKLQLSYLALSTDYKPTTQTAEDINPDTFTKSEESYQTNLALEDDEAAKVADVMLKVMRTEREDEQKFSLPIQYVGIIPSDILSIEGRRYRVDQMRVERNRVVIERAVYDRASAYYSEAVGVEGIRRPPPVSTVRGPVASAAMNAPVLRDSDDRAGIYWAAAGYLSGYRGALLQMSRDGTTFENGPEITNVSTMGLLTADLPSASAYAQDNTNTLRVRMYPGGKDLDSTTYDGLIAEDNVAAILYPDGTTEIIQFQTAVETADREYDLTGLMRGRQDTTPGEHLTGAQFVMLDEDVRFVAIRPDDVGKTLTFRAVSLGTNPDDNATQTITFTTIESLREWQPYSIIVTEDGAGGYCVEWIGRGRLGSSLVPIHSQWFEGYRVTFTIGDLVHTVDTTAQEVCVTAAALIETFGSNHGIPTITVRARSRVATGDDDFDSPPGVPTTDPNPSYGAVIVGGPSDGYVGEPIFDALGPMHSPPFQAYGGKTEERFTGDIVGNVTCQSSSPGSGVMVGIPLTAETRNAATEMIPTGPDVGPGGPFLIADSVTIAAKPTYSMMDESKPLGGKVLVTTVTTPARTTKKITSIGLGGLKSRAGTDTDKVRCAFTITSMPSGGRLYVGVLAGGEDAHLAPGTGGSYGHLVTADGTYVVELDGATGDIEVFEIGVGSVATAMLPSTYAYDGLYRFAWSANDVIHPAAGAIIHTNMGNESWPDTPTVGFGGLLNADTIVPCGFDATVGTANGYWLQGVSSLTEATSGGISATSLVYAYSAFGKSTGKWRIGMRGLSTSRLGFCKAGHTGLLGASGTADSIGFTDTRGPEGFVIDTSFGGVFNRITIPPLFYYAHPLVYFAFDTDANTLGIYVKVEIVAGDPTATYALLTTLTGIPSGTWLPAVNGAAQLVPEIPEPATYDDWTITL